ncbi:MAG TPA: ferredoxin family protein [Prolixibacteraceae bacterium]|nr:ferredoxin family protein [Prolixibacteraceae bacterium]HPS13242.1 ferredoxin family protein [Prolixibacteraceae bacterium]
MKIRRDRRMRGHNQTSHVGLNTRVCKACWKCVDSCQKQVIGKVDFLGHRHALIRKPDQCVGCFKCMKVCENGAFFKLN